MAFASARFDELEPVQFQGAVARHRDVVVADAGQRQPPVAGGGRRQGDQLATRQGGDRHARGAADHLAAGRIEQARARTGVDRDRDLKAAQRAVDRELQVARTADHALGGQQGFWAGANVGHDQAEDFLGFFGRALQRVQLAAGLGRNGVIGRIDRRTRAEGKESDGDVLGVGLGDDVAGQRGVLGRGIGEDIQLGAVRRGVDRAQRAGHGQFRTVAAAGGGQGIGARQQRRGVGRDKGGADLGIAEIDQQVAVGLVGAGAHRLDDPGDGRLDPGDHAAHAAGIVDHEADRAAYVEEGADRLVVARDAGRREDLADQALGRVHCGGARGCVAGAARRILVDAGVEQ